MQFDVQDITSARVGAPRGSQNEQLLLHVGALFAGLEGLVGPAVYRQFCEIFESLCPRVEDRCLVQFSQQIATLDYSPHATIQQLAFHEFDDVAEPVIHHSPVLSADDISQIIQSMSLQRAQIVAGRPRLGAPHCAQLLDLDQAEIYLALAANMTADLSILDLVRMADRASRDSRLIAVLSNRASLPIAVSDQLTSAGLNVVRRMTEGEVVRDRRLSERPLSANVSLEDYETAEEYLRPIIADGDLDEGHLLRFASRNLTALVLLTLSHLTKCRRQRIEQIICSSAADDFIVLARQAELSEAAVMKILEFGTWRRRLTRSARESALAQFRSLTVADARLLFKQAA